MKCRARTEEDCRKAYREGMAAGIRKAVMFFLYISCLYMADKLGHRQKRLTRWIEYLMKYGEMIKDGDVTMEEIKNILIEEYDLEIRLVE